MEQVLATGSYTPHDISFRQFDILERIFGEGTAFPISAYIPHDDTITSRCVYLDDNGVRNPVVFLNPNHIDDDVVLVHEAAHFICYKYFPHLMLAAPSAAREKVADWAETQIEASRPKAKSSAVIAKMRNILVEASA